MPENTKKNNEENKWKERIFHSLSFPTLVLKPDKKIIGVNEIFLEKYGVTREQVIGKHCHEIFYQSKESCPPNRCPLPKVFRDRKGHSVLKHVISEDNQETWEDRVFSPILNDDGEVDYILESVRDITHQKTMERELIEIRGFLVKAVESSASAIVAGDTKGKIILMNPAAEDLFGYSAFEAVGRELVVLLYPPGGAREIMKKLRDENFGGKGKLPVIRTTIINTEGQEIPVEMTASIIYEGNNEVATMAIYNDLREKLAVEKKLEEARAQLAQSEKMASLGQLAAGVAHEINNPLGGILLYGNLALEKLIKDDPLYKYLEYVIEDANRCKDIVKHLLAYSRQTSPNKNIVQLNNLLEQSLTLIRDQAMLRNIEVIKDFSHEMMLVKVDDNQMRQVIINLVMNAVDAMEGKGTLTFCTYRSVADKKVYIEVSDTGCGLPEENLSKIFDPFFTTKEPGKGTGLGLSTAYGIVEENGGRISVKESSPRGTTFQVELPLYKASDHTLII